MYSSTHYHAAHFIQVTWLHYFIVKQLFYVATAKDAQHIHLFFSNVTYGMPNLETYTFPYQLFWI